MFINAAWLVPAFGSVIEEPSVSAVVSLLANLTFDIGGILTPAGTQNGKVISDNVVALIVLLTIAYGVLSAVYGIAQLFDSSAETKPAAAGAT